MVLMESSMQFSNTCNDPIEGAEGIDEECRLKFESFWNDMSEDIRKLTPKDFKEMELPIARIKRIMKLDEDVKMIAGETPLLFAKAAEFFIKDLTLRAWLCTEENKRRTLQRNDISAAAGKCEMFDFLIDVLPREDAKTSRRAQTTQVQTSAANSAAYIPQNLPQMDNAATLAIPAVSGDQMQHIVIQLPASILSALSPQKNTASSGMTVMQHVPVTLPAGAIAQQPQLALPEATGAVTGDGSHLVTVSSGEMGGATIQLSAAQLQSLIQPAALKQSMQPQQQ